MYIQEGKEDIVNMCRCSLFGLVNNVVVGDVVMRECLRFQFGMRAKTK